MNLTQTSKVLNEIESRKILKKYNITQNNYLFAETMEETLNAANQLKYPLVMKVVSEKIVHKTDFGGVQIGLNNEEDVRKAYKKIYENALQKGVSPKEIDGISIQEMENGMEEILIGVKRDQVFGPVILVGFGGVLVELMKDVALGILPLDEEDVYKMLQKLKGYSLLNGYRGRKRADIDSIVKIVLKVQLLVLNETNIIELDLNPVFVKEDDNGCIAVDARIVIQ